MKKIIASTTASRNIIGHDVVKMFAAAMMVGLTFSAFAVAVSLMLAHTSTAHASQAKLQTPSALWVSQHGLWVLKQDEQLVDDDIDDDDVDALTPSPGHLNLGDGCGSTPIIATERDWQVTINGETADIQVMQTFVIPTTDGTNRSIEESVYFGAVLPRGAFYTSFRIQTHSHELLGEYAGNSYFNNDAGDTAQLKSRGLVRVYENHHASGVTHLSSDTIHSLAQGETVVVTYRYQMPIENISHRESSIRIALHDDQLTDDAQNSVWINWLNTAEQMSPKALINKPRGLNVERTPNGKRIIAASYENITLQKSAKKDSNQFQLRWAM